jgi:hypothetical protein
MLAHRRVELVGMQTRLVLCRVPSMTPGIQSYVMPRAISFGLHVSKTKGT